MTIINGERAFTIPDWLVGEWLQQLLGDATGFPAGICEPPRDSTTHEVVPYPYYVLYPVPAGAYADATLAFPDAQCWCTWQVVGVGEMAEQVVKAMDRARVAILGRAADGTFLYDAPATDISVDDRQSEDGAGAVPPMAGGDWPEQIWSSYKRYELYVNQGSG
jgi:hypothetical protein